jgi:hypothetical protein
MIAVSDKTSGASLGSITESQLRILVDHLEETSLDDQDYHIDRRTIDVPASLSQRPLTPTDVD